jgi:hypothetical protein
VSGGARVFVDQAAQDRFSVEALPGDQHAVQELLLPPWGRAGAVVVAFIAAAAVATGGGPYRLRPAAAGP